MKKQNTKNNQSIWKIMGWYILISMILLVLSSNVHAIEEIPDPYNGNPPSFPPPADTPTVFSPNTPASAEDVNKNFELLRAKTSEIINGWPTASLPLGCTIDQIVKSNGDETFSCANNEGGASPWESDGSNIYYDGGNVGIGTDNPAYKLQIQDEVIGGSFNALSLSNYTTGGTITNSSVRIYFDGGRPGHGPSTMGWIGGKLTENFFETGQGLGSGGSRLEFNAGNVDSPEMVIISNGKVGIGMTNPLENLDVSGCIKYNNGTLGTACASDQRLKTNIRSLHFDNVLEIIEQLRPKTYQFKSDEHSNTYLGFIAQDVEKIAPKLVGTNEEGYKTLDYESIKFMMYQAVQEHQQLIKQLKTENDTLKAMVEQVAQQTALLSQELKNVQAVMHTMQESPKVQTAALTQ